VPSLASATPCGNLSLEGLNAARAYVAALAGTPDAPTTFQAIPEYPGACGYPSILHGTLADLWPRLCDLQDEGCGVFVTINETDGRGRRVENIRAVRAVFADQDEPDGMPDFGDAPPTLVVMSGRGEHYLWAVKPGERLEDFTPAQKGIAAKLGSDPKVSDLARVLRLPGSFHLKSGTPRMVELVHCDPSARYAIADVLSGLGAEPVLPTTRRLVAPAPPTDGRRVLGSDARFRAERYLAQIHAVSGSGGNHATYKAAAAALNNFGLPAETAWSVLKEWNERHAQPPWSEPELARVFQNAARYARDAS
jgi:hypothetical protein